MTDYEKDLIPPDRWPELYEQMLLECKEVVGGPPDCTGIGKSEKLGWFICGSGQGPCLLWSEKEAEKEDLY